MKIKKMTFLFFVFFLSFSSAQWIYFGRNKVQYYDFHWKIMETEHFKIYYYEEMKDIAGIGAKFAEESYLELEKKFEFSIPKKIPLIFYASHLHFEQTNVTPGFIPEGVGGFFEFMKGRVVLPADGNLASFKHVIQHELVHVFSYYKIYTVYKTHGRRTGMMPPLWFTEGLAEYWSKPWDAMADLLIRDAILHNNLVPLQEMYKIYGSFFMYKEGEAICRFIAEKYGERTLLQLIDRIWKYENFEEVFKEVLQTDYRTFSEKWAYELKRKYFPFLKDMNFIALALPPVTRKGLNMKPLIYNVNGDSIVIFYTNRLGYPQLVWTPLRKQGIHSEEDLHVIFSGARNPEFENFHLFDSNIDISRNGILVFSTKSYQSDRLVLYDFNKQKIILKKRFKGITAIRSMTIDPSGTKIVFSGLTFGGQSDLFLWDRVTQQLYQLTNDIYLDDEPDFSPDGEKIVFVSNRFHDEKHDWKDLFLLDLQSRIIKPLTSASFSVYSPKWDRKGNRIYFIADRNYFRNIYLLDMEKSAKNKGRFVQITNTLSGIWDLATTHGGNLVISAYENQSLNFYLLNTENKILKIIPDSVFITKKSPHMKNFLAIGQTQIAQAKKREYRTRYQLDFAQSQVTQDPFWGTQGGAVLSFSDMLSDRYFTFVIFNNATTSTDFFRSLNFSASYFNLKKRMNYGLGIYRLAGRFFNFKDQFFFEDRVGGFLALSYPFSQFSRLEMSLNVDYSDKEVLGGPRRFAWLYSQYISYVQDNSLFFVSGPIDGHRLNITIGQTTDWRFAKVHYISYLIDYRYYHRLTFRSALAFRLMYLGNSGKETRWYYLGGSWDLRGYSLWSLRGENIGLFSTELRFPFLDLLVMKFPFVNMYFPQIRGAAFVDIGDAWSGGFDPSDLKGAMGIGWRLNLFGVIVIRFDMGKKFNFRNKRLEPKIFTQLFFGWDF